MDTYIFVWLYTLCLLYMDGDDHSDFMPPPVNPDLDSQTPVFKTFTVLNISAGNSDVSESEVTGQPLRNQLTQNLVLIVKCLDQQN